MIYFVMRTKANFSDDFRLPNFQSAHSVIPHLFVDNNILFVDHDFNVDLHNDNVFVCRPSKAAKKTMVPRIHWSKLHTKLGTTRFWRRSRNNKVYFVGKTMKMSYFNINRYIIQRRENHGDWRQYTQLIPQVHVMISCDYMSHTVVISLFSCILLNLWYTESLYLLEILA